MRVATRRLRAALALFAGVLPVRAQVFREELGWLGRLLGAVRDLDVQLEGLAESAGGAGAGAPAPDGGPRPARGALGPAGARAGRGPGRHVERARLGPLGAPGQRPGRHGAAGAGAPLAGRRGSRRHRHARPRRRAAHRGGQGGQAGQEVRRGGGLPPVAHPLQAAALRARVQRRGLRRAHLPLRPPAHRAAGRTRAHAGRRSGVDRGWPIWPPARPTCRRRPCSSWAAWPSGTGATSIGSCAACPRSCTRSVGGSGGTSSTSWSGGGARPRPPCRRCARTLRAVPATAARDRPGRAARSGRRRPPAPRADHPAAVARAHGPGARRRQSGQRE